MHRIEALLFNFAFDHTGNEWFGAVPCGNTCKIWHEIRLFMTIYRADTHSFSPGWTHEVEIRTSATNYILKYDCLKLVHSGVNANAFLQGYV